MRERTENWRDVLSAYALALDAKKLYLGFLGVLGSVLVLLVFAGFHRALGLAGTGHLSIPRLGDMLVRALSGGTAGRISPGALLPLLNPLADGIVHFLLSVLFYAGLMLPWAYFGGAITRLTALEYGRDELPTLRDGTDMVRDRFRAFWLAPVSPLVGLAIFLLLNALGGLIGSIPYAGPILMIIGILPWFIATGIALFLIVLGVMSFGLIFPSISIGGKDAFEGWSSAFSYVLWGFGRFVGYGVLAVAVGVLTTVAAWGICELFIHLLLRSLHWGLPGGTELVRYGTVGSGIAVTVQGSLMHVASVAMVVALMLVRVIPLAYAFAYFFTAGTVICLLMRKHVDRIEVDEIYEEGQKKQFRDFEEDEFASEEPPQSPGEEFETEGEAETPESTADREPEVTEEPPAAPEEPADDQQ